MLHNRASVGYLNGSCSIASRRDAITLYEVHRKYNRIVIIALISIPPYRVVKGCVWIRAIRARIVAIFVVGSVFTDRGSRCPGIECTDVWTNIFPANSHRIQVIIGNLWLPTTTTILALNVGRNGEIGKCRLIWIFLHFGHQTMWLSDTAQLLLKILYKSTLI